MSCLTQQTEQPIHSKVDVFMFKIKSRSAAATRLLQGSRGFGELDFVNTVQFSVIAKEMFDSNNNIPVNSQYPGN